MSVTINTMQRGRRHQATVDGRTVWLDSDTEEYSLKRFVEKYGFSGKWARSRGIKFRGKYYTADFELSVADKNGQYSLALVEVKQYRKNMTMGMAKRMYVIAHHFSTKHCYLYTYKSDRWYIVGKNGSIMPCAPPSPSDKKITDHYRPKYLITRRLHGRRYYQSFSDLVISFLFGYNTKR